MKVAIIQDNLLNESLALTESVSYLEKFGHCFELFVQHEEKHFEESIRYFSPDVFLVPSDIGGHHWAHRIAFWIKRRFDRPLITGGTYPTFYPHSVLKDDNFNYLVAGESEIALKKLLHSLETKSETVKIPGVWQRRGKQWIRNGIGEVILNLDSLPLPRRDLYYKYSAIKRFGLKRFCSGRGCYNTCSYCLNPQLRKAFPKDVPYVRRKSVERVIMEIKDVRRTAPVRSIHFSDDIFITNPEWISEFSARFPAEIGMLFSCNIRLELLTFEIIDQLKKSGCHAVALGIETGNESLRKKVLWRRFTNSEAIEKVRYLRDRGIQVVSFNMLGLPGETLENSIETFSLNREMRVSHVRVNMNVPLPGSELAKMVDADGEKVGRDLLSIDRMPDFSEGKHFVNHVTSERDFKNLMLLFPFFYRFKSFIPAIRFFSRKRYLPVFRVFSIVSIFMEKRFFRIDLISGIKYFLRTGSPYKRSKNSASLI